MPPEDLAEDLDTGAQRGARALADRFPDLGPGTVLIQAGTGFDATGLLDEPGAPVRMAEVLGASESPSPAGHPLVFRFGRCEGRTVLLASGRRHMYEGRGMAPCVLPVCAAVQAGVRDIVLVSAAGAVQSELKPGTVLAVTDHLNNLGASPLTGNQSMLPLPFPDMSAVYSQRLIGAFVNAAGDVGVEPRLGVYQANPGPQFETPAEVDMARRNGADVVGMSLVPEAIMAHALGAEVMGLAVVANQAAHYGGRAVSHDDVLEAVDFASRYLVRSLRAFLRALPPACSSVD